SPRRLCQWRRHRGRGRRPPVESAAGTLLPRLHDDHDDGGTPLARIRARNHQGPKDGNLRGPRACILCSLLNSAQKFPVSKGLDHFTLWNSGPPSRCGTLILLTLSSLCRHCVAYAIRTAASILAMSSRSASTLSNK